MKIYRDRLIGLAVFLATVLSPVSLKAQVVSSLYTPLGICSLYSSQTPANTIVHLQVRDECGIPQEANAVTLIATTVLSSGNGVMYVWDSGTPIPYIPSMYYRTAPGGDSQTLVVRLCYPFLDCSGVDIDMLVTASAYVTLSAVGYHTPAD